MLFRDIWTCERLARCILDRHPELGTFDASNAWRYFHAAAVRPHHEEMWLHSPDPAFRAKVTEVCAKDCDYIRHGTRAPSAAFNPQTGEVFGHIGATRKADDLMAFMEEVAQRHPAGDVHIVWDNLNIHHDGPSGRWTALKERHGGRFHSHHTPIHASWVNQVESWFAILQKRILRHGVFDSVEARAERVAGFIEHWNSSRHPFRWEFRGYPLEARESAA